MSTKRTHYSGPATERTACGRSVYRSPIGVEGLPEVSTDWAEVDCRACWRRAFGHGPVKVDG